MPQLRQNEREQDVGMLLAGMAQTQIANHFNVLLWLRRLERWLEGQRLFVEVFPVPGSRATTMVLRVTATGRGRV
jgi:hypothetical protein